VCDTEEQRQGQVELAEEKAATSADIKRCAVRVVSLKGTSSRYLNDKCLPLEGVLLETTKE
jgi:hypothetical protein